MKNTKPMAFRLALRKFFVAFLISISLALSAWGANTIDLVWGIPTNSLLLVTNGVPITGYNIQQSTNGSAFTTILTVLGASTTNATVPYAGTNVNYCFRVNGYNDGGTGEFSNVACRITPWPPSIVTEPSSITAYVGGGASFTVSATGRSPLTYQWYKDGSLLPNATNSTYGLTTVQASNEGNYWVVVANVDGAKTSATARLTVYGLPCGPILIRVIVSPPQKP